MIEEITTNLTDKVSLKETSDDDDHKWKIAIDLVNSGLLPKLDIGEDRPIFKQDFLSTRDNRLSVLNQVYETIQNIPDKTVLVENKTLLKHLIVPVFLLCGEYAQASEWSDSAHILASYKLLSCLKTKVFKNANIGAILLENGQLLKWCLESLQAKLSKDEWKLYPGARYSFAWHLRQVTQPHLSGFLHEFLPFSLRFLDDWEIPTKVFAIHCLDHIIEHTSKSELVNFGYTEVLKEALFHVLNHREVSLVPCTYSTLFKFIEKCDRVKNSHERFAKMDTWDELAKILFYAMETETKLELKRLYGKQLGRLLSGLNLGIVRWLTTALKVVSSYTEFTDPQQEEFRIDVLDNLLQILDICGAAGEEGSRVKWHAEVIFELLVRLLYEWSKSARKLQHEQKIFHLTVLSLKKTALAAPQEFNVHFQGIKDVSVNESFDSVIRDILTPPSAVEEVQICNNKK